MSSQKGGAPECEYSEHPDARNFLVLLTATAGNSASLRKRRVPFTVLEVRRDSFPFLGGSLLLAARGLLGETVISITEKKVLSGQPWIAKYGKESTGEALTCLVEGLFGALPASESALVFSNPGGVWRLTGFRIGSGAQEASRAEVLRSLR